MSKNTPETSVIPIDQAAVWSPDPLTEVLRTGAQRLLAQAVEAEIEAHLAAHKELLDDRGRRRVVRHAPPKPVSYTHLTLPTILLV